MTIDANGLKIDEFATIYDRLANKFKDIYGVDIELSQDTPDGQMVGIFANEVYDLQTLILYLYNSLDPDFAQGQELNKILKLIAQQRRASTRSQADITIIANENVTLPATYRIIDINGFEWQINQATSVTTGTNTVSFNAVDFGAIEAPANTINEVVTVYTQITSVNNPLPANIGVDEESDILLRKRRNRLLEVNSKSTIAGIYSKLFLIDEVQDARVYDNSTDVYDATLDVYDATLDVYAHTLWVIVDGGAVDEITKIIAEEKTQGCGLKGKVKATYQENFLRGDGTTRIHYHEIKFDRPTETNIYIKLNVTKKNVTDIIDTDAIKNKLIEKLYSIGENGSATELYSYVYQSGTTFIASDLLMSKNNITYTETLTADFDEKFIITDANILITEV